MNQLERRLFEMLQVLAGERGDKNKRAVRLDEIQGLVNQFDNQSVVKALETVKAEADAQGVSINEILAEIVAVNTRADNIILNTDAELQSLRDSVDAVEQGVQDALVESTGFTVSLVNESASLIRDQFLDRNEAGYWQRWSAQGSLITPENEAFSFGKSWRFQIISGQEDGMTTRSDEQNWRGASGSDVYRVEIDFTLVAGGLSGAGVLFEWVNTAGGVFQVAAPLSSMIISPAAIGVVSTASLLFRRPEGFTGTFDFNRLYLAANATALGNAAKTIAFHKCVVKPATKDEALVVEVQAEVENEALLRVNADQALAADINTVQTNLNGTNATVSQQASAISTLEGNAAATLAFRTKAGTAGAQLELISASDPTGNTSIARIDATNIILNGTVSAPMMNVDSLSAITSDIGTVTAGRIRSADSKFVIDLNAKTITITV